MDSLNTAHNERTVSEWAKMYMDSGLSVVPIKNADLTLAGTSWKASQTKIVDYNFEDAIGLVVICGSVSGRGENLEVIDFDLKNDVSGDLMKRYRELVNEVDPNLLKKLLIEKTKSGGYHLVYRTGVWAKGEHCAMRNGTEEEKLAAYNKAIANGKSESDAKRDADKVHSILIETLADRMPCNVFPTPGYKLEKGNFLEIPKITSAEREVLLDCARQFNEYFVPPDEIDTSRMGAFRVSPFKAYNDKDDFVDLLESEGWRQIGRPYNGLIPYVKPDSKTKIRNATLNPEKKWFYVFTPQTSLPDGKTLTPSDVFIELRANGSAKSAYKMLLDMGHGEAMPPPAPNGHKTVDEKPEPKKFNAETPEFLATDADFDPYLNAVRDGTLQMGLKTNMEILDRYFRFKRGYFVPINGHDNVGKTVVVVYLMVLSALYHGWKWGIMSNENSNGGIRRKLIEFYFGRPITELSDEDFEKGKAWAKKHFQIIKVGEEGYTHYDVMEMGSIMKEKFQIDGFLIDPYNSLDVDESKLLRLNTHEYHYKVLGLWRRWAKKNDCCMYVCCHAVTAAIRAKDKSGRPLPPAKADTEQGSKFAARADDFLTIHRDVGDAVNYKITEIYVRKIKEVETGGRTSPVTEPVQMVMQDLCRFVYGNNRDAVKEWHEKNEGKIPKPAQQVIENFENSRELPKEKEHQYTLEPDLNDPGF